MGRRKTPKSTLSNPQGFFEGVAKTNFIETLKNEYLENMHILQLERPEDFTSFDFANYSYAHKIIVKGEIILESKGGKMELVDNSFETIKKHSLISDLQKRFNDEVDKSIQLIDDTINNAPNIERTKVLITILINKLNSLSISPVDTICEPIMRSSLERILQHIRTFMSPTDVLELESIQDNKLNDKNKRIQNLNPFLKELMEIENDTAADSIQLFNGDSKQGNYFINAINAVISKREIPAAEVPVTEWDKLPVAYILTKLSKHLASFEIKNTLVFQPIQFKDQGFFNKADNIYTASSKFSKKNCNLKLRIDEVFEKHLK